MAEKVHAARNLPITACQILTGSVISNSIVPLRRSSAHKRIASAESREQLRELQVELIDRFGLLPEAAKNLMRIAAIKQDATTLGIDKIDVSESGGYIQFGGQSRVDPLALVQLVQEDGQTYRMQSAHRLQFRKDLGEASQRFKFIEELLTLLVAKPGAEKHQAMAG